jgi:hypothetical protein
VGAGGFENDQARGQCGLHLHPLGGDDAVDQTDCAGLHLDCESRSGGLPGDCTWIGMQPSGSDCVIATYRRRSCTLNARRSTGRWRVWWVIGKLLQNRLIPSLAEVLGKLCRPCIPLCSSTLSLVRSTSPVALEGGLSRRNPEAGRQFIAARHRLKPPGYRGPVAAPRMAGGPFLPPMKPSARLASALSSASH